MGNDVGGCRSAVASFGGGRLGGHAPLAQSAERLHGKEKVDSSILSGGSGRRSSAGESARLIIERSTVRICPSLRSNRVPSGRTSRWGPPWRLVRFSARGHPVGVVPAGTPNPDSPEEPPMPKVCEVTGRKPGFGKKVSHSHRRTNRRWDPNVQRKRYWLPSERRWITLNLSTKGIKTIDRRGIESVVAEMRRRGQKV